MPGPAGRHPPGESARVRRRAQPPRRRRSAGGAPWCAAGSTPPAHRAPRPRARAGSRQAVARGAGSGREVPPRAGSLRWCWRSWGCCCPRCMSSHRSGSDVESGFEEGESMPDPNGASPLKRQSARLTEGDDRAGARAMLRAIGFTREDLAKPLIGVGHSWIETMPCNFNHRRLAEKVKAGIRAAGGTPMEFNTIAVSDGVSMGTEGMKASLVSREVIADSIELVTRGHLFDGLVLITGCDKTIPAAVMALVRINIPGLALYSGTIAAGRHRGRDITLMEGFEAVGAVAAGKMDAVELREVEENACPGAGACGGQFTANTMSTAIEFLGISPAGANDVPALDPRKDDVAEQAGRLVMDLIKEDLRPRQIITRAALENAIASVAATGGSTNGVLHLLA